MILKYDEFYRKFGTYLPRDFVYPKLLDVTTTVLPYYINMHYLNYDEETPPTREYLELKNIKSITCITNMDYKHIYKNPLRKQKINKSQLFNKIKRAEPSFKHIKDDELRSFIKRNIRKFKLLVPVFNNNIRDEDYIYKADYLGYKDRYINRIRNIMLDVIDYYKEVKSHNYREEVNQLLVINVPDVLFKYKLVEKFILNPHYTKEEFEIFYNDDLMFIMDMFKLSIVSELDNTFLNPILKEPNALQILKSLNIMFKNSNKILFINMAHLLSMIGDLSRHPVIGRIVKSRFSGKIYRKLFYLLYKRLITLRPVTTDDIDDNSYIEKEENLMKGFLSNKHELLAKLESDDFTEKDIDQLLKEEEEDDSKEEIVIETTEYKYKDIKSKDELLKESKDIISEIKETIEEKYENGYIDTKTYKKLMEKLKKIMKEKISNETIEKLLEIKEDDLGITEDETILFKPKTLLTDDNKDVINVFDSKYLNKVYRKDLIRSILAIQRSGILITGIEHKHIKDILGGYEEFKLNLLSDKKNFSVKFVIPVINKDGTYKISGNTYILRKQRADLPIKKIAPNRVSLSSAYGKLFIDKAPMKKYDRGYAIRRELLKLLEAKKIKNYIGGTLKVYEVKLPTTYAEIARYTKSFKVGDYFLFFNYLNRINLVNNDEELLKKVEANNKYVLIGKNEKNGNLLVIDYNNDIYEYKNGKYELIGNVLEVAGIDRSKLKPEFSVARIYKALVPTGLLLSYYMGLENLVKSLDSEIIVYEGRKIIKEPGIVLKFKDKTVLIKPKDDLAEMILYGLTIYNKEFSKLTYKPMNNKSEFAIILNGLGFKLHMVTEIKLLEKLFVDPVTETILKDMKMPTTFRGLLVKASEMLLDDYYIHPNSLKGFVIRGYERIPQLVYRTIVDAIREKENAEFFGRTKLHVDPFKVWRTINEDSSSILVDDLNPIIYLKQKEDTTYLGEGGRKKESMSKATREYHPDDIGVISEATKDSGDVGITAYLSASPVFKNIRGLKADVDISKLTWSNVMSTSGLLAPFATRDDPKRVNYINIQNTHIIPIKNAKIFPVRTGYESVLAYRLPPKFVGWAEHDGKVVKITKDYITVDYGKNGKKKYSIRSWTSKEESNTTYKHVLVPNVKEGQKVKKWDILYYDEGFFEPDMFDPTKVNYRANTIIRVAFNETPKTYEDAVSISKRLAESAKIPIVKVRSLILNCDDEIDDIATIGDKVDYNDPLFIIRNKLLKDEKIDKKTLEMIKSLTQMAPKAKYKGVIEKIMVYYNCEYKNLSKGLKKLVDISKPYMVDEITGEQLEGRVNSSYSVDGKPLEEGKVHIKYYIATEKSMGTGDKGIIANQLKTTVTDVYDYPIVTEDGDPIDAIFSYKGVLARIVGSADLMGATATLLEAVGKKAAEIYGIKKDK